MKRVMFLIFIFLSVMVCITSLGWAGAVDDIKAGNKAAEGGEHDKAIRLFTKAIESGELSQENLGIAYYNRGNAWYRKGEYDKAIADYTKAIESGEFSQKSLGIVYATRGSSWDDKGEYDKAIADCTKAIELNPKDAKTYYIRGFVWRKKGEYDKTIADYTKALEINPKDAYAYNGLAWLMATCPEDRYRDGKQAVVLAEKAVELDETTSRLDTLAAAYAEAGRFQDAIKTLERAIAKLKEEGKAKAIPKYEKHLSSYKAGKPWREK